MLTSNIKYYNRSSPTLASLQGRNMTLKKIKQNNHEELMFQDSDIKYNIQW